MITINIRLRDFMILNILIDKITCFEFEKFNFSARYDFGKFISQTVVMITRHVLYSIITFSLLSCIKEDSPNDPPPDEIPVEITSKVLAGNLNYPWEILWGPDNMIWMTERQGRITRVDPATGSITPLATIDEVVSTGEGGLLGMVLYPAFTQPSNVYVAYNYTKSGTYTGKVVRYDYINGTLSNPFVIIDDLKASGIHNGCRLVISADEKLFITTGDASDQSTPQNFSSLNGKILRVNLDGSIPADNRSEEHTSELQSQSNLVCRLLLEK